MKELRCIVFNDLEVLGAVLERRRKLKEPMPEGQVTGIRLDRNQGTRCVLMIDQGREQVQISETELQAALLSYCIAKNVPLPVDAEKSVYLIRGKATLMITMNFNKSARLVAVLNEDGSPLNRH